MKIGIAAHITREPMAMNLMDQVGAEVLNVDEVVGRKRQDAITACANNHLTVMRRLSELAKDEWCIILEDDALPISNFRARAEDALRYARSPLIGFYIGRAGTPYNLGILQEAFSTETAWVVTNHMLNAVAYAIRSDVLQSVIDRYAGCSPAQTVEARISEWAAGNRRFTYGEPRFYYTAPSLVDHWDGESLVNPDVDSQIRKAWAIGAPRNWNTPALEYYPVEVDKL